MDKWVCWAYIDAQSTFLYEYIINAHTARYNRQLSVRQAEDMAQEMRDTGHMPVFIIEYTKDRLAKAGQAYREEFERRKRGENLTNEFSPVITQMVLDFPKT